jgi:leucyl aminopeptidase
MNIKKLLTGSFLLLILTAGFFSCIKEKPYTSPDPDPNDKEYVTRILCGALNRDSIKSGVEWLQGMGTRFAFAEDHRKVAVKIRDKFIRMGYTNAYIDSFWVSMIWRYQNFSAWEYNVVATLTGSSNPDSLSIIGAHYDDILSTGDPVAGAPGANDNASGVASMMEIARIMKTKHFTPGISIMFVAFGAEELGLLGSGDFVAKLALSGRPVRFTLNNDMIGYEPTSNTAYWTVKITPYDNSAQLTLDAKTYCNYYANILSETDTAKYKNFDSYSFYKKTYPTISFTAKTPDPNYHTVDDLASFVNYNYCIKVASISVALLVYSNKY